MLASCLHLMNYSELGSTCGLQWSWPALTEHAGLFSTLCSCVQPSARLQNCCPAIAWYHRFFSHSRPTQGNVTSVLSSAGAPTCPAPCSAVILLSPRPWLTGSSALQPGIPLLVASSSKHKYIRYNQTTLGFLLFIKYRCVIIFAFIWKKHNYATFLRWLRMGTAVGEVLDICVQQTSCGAVQLLGEGSAAAKVVGNTAQLRLW